MLSESDLRELLEYSAPDPVVSIYLNTDPAEGNADAYKLRLRNMLKDINLTQDVQAIERYMDYEYDWSGRSVAIFSSAAQSFFRAYPLAIPLSSRMRVNNHPAVKPLADLLDSYGGYGVVLVDKQGARLFFFHLGSLREQEGVLGETVKRTKKGGASSFPGRRGGTAGQTDYVDEIIDRNMRDAVEFAVHFFEENHVRRILIGGTDDNISLFKSMLPKAWQSLVVGTFASSMTASHLEVLNRAMQVGREAEKKREMRLIDLAITNSAKGANGVVGINDTLEAVQAERIQTLLIMEGYHSPGFHCGGCGYLTSIKQDVCPICGGEFKEIQDAVELAVHRVMQNGGDVEVIHEGPALEEVGKIGALLRY